MSYDLSPAAERLVREKLASGRYSSFEQLLLAALESLEMSNEDESAIALGLESLDRGEPGVTLDEAFSRLRQKHEVRD
jgi:Arc/MetJ-type ribon-helix-helix transcriptional regulator